MGRLPETTLDRSLVLVAQLMELADQMLLECEDHSCLLFGAIVRDSAYQIKRAVEGYRTQSNLPE
jgi:hypothetical protein